MEVSISEHLQEKALKKFLLLLPLVAFKSNNEGRIIYNDITYVNRDRGDGENAITNVYSRRQKYTFPNTFGGVGNHGNDDWVIKVLETKNRHRSISIGDDFPQFNFTYDKINLAASLSPDNFILVMGDSSSFDDKFVLEYDGKLVSVQHKEEVSIGGKIIINSDEYKIGEIGIRKLEEFYGKPNKNKVFVSLEIYPDKTIKKYGKKINGMKEGLFYDSDESGNFEISGYVNDKLHGYYFNSQTGEQGFYENGVKVGFWKEGDEIVNYDTPARIFFTVPTFIF